MLTIGVDRGRSILDLLLAHLHLHQLLRLELNLLSFSMCVVVFGLHALKRLILLLKHFIMFHQCILVHDLQLILVLLILVLEIIEALAVGCGDHMHFILVGDLHLLLHLLEGLYVVFAPS